MCTSSSATGFQSTLPAWGETLQRWPPPAPPKFQSTLPAWGETRHAASTAARQQFQSTLPAWGETYQYDNFCALGGHFNPLSPHGERPRVCGARPRTTDFNPLSPHGERQRPGQWRGHRWHFNPLSPHGERLTVSTAPPQSSPISIHSPRMGRDPSGILAVYFMANFNPLSPHGERRFDGNVCRLFRVFQSTLPAWGETILDISLYKFDVISIHSPRMGRDCACDY